MATKADTIECLKKSLTDVRCRSISLTIEEMLFRTDPAGNKHPRIRDIDGNEIKSIEDFIGAIKEEDAIETRMRHTASEVYNGYMAWKIELKNIFINVSNTLAGDSNLRHDFATHGLNNPSFVMTYLCDGDTDIKVKPVYMQLEVVSKEEEDKVFESWK